MNRIKQPQDEFNAMGRKMFGPKLRHWVFVCPKCRTEQSGETFEKVTSISKEKISEFLGYSCVGRFNDQGVGCDWTLGGLFKIHEKVVIDRAGQEHPIFLFAGEKARSINPGNRVECVDDTGKKAVNAFVQ